MAVIADPGLVADLAYQRLEERFGLVRSAGVRLAKHGRARYRIWVMVSHDRSAADSVSASGMVWSAIGALDE